MVVKYLQESLNDMTKHDWIAKSLVGKTWKMKAVKKCSDHMILAHEDFKAEVLYSIINQENVNIDDMVEVNISLAYNKTNDAWFFLAEKSIDHKIPEKMKTKTKKTNLHPPADRAPKDNKKSPVQTPNKPQPKVQTNSLTNAVRAALPKLFALCKKDETSINFSKGKNLQGQSQFNSQDKRFIRKCLEVIRIKDSVATQPAGADIVNEDDFETRLKSIDVLTSEIAELESGFREPDDLGIIYGKYRILEQLQLDNFSRRDSLASPLEQFLSNNAFTGTILSTGAGLGRIGCRYFKYPVVLYLENLTEGLIQAGATVRFKAEFFLNQQNRPAFKAVCATSSALKREFKPCIVQIQDPVTLKMENQIHEGLNSDKPVLVVYSKNKISHYRKVLTQKYPEMEIQHGMSMLSNIGPFIYKELLNNCSLIACRETINKADFSKNVISTVIAHLSAQIMKHEKNDWVVVMDETGACRDYQHIERIPESPSAMMAVIIPPGSQLPPCPYGYHSIESKEDSNKLRKHLLAKAEIVVFVWPYEEASPYARSDEKNLSLHAQMWRHAVTLCLEYIAQQVAGKSTKQNLRLYIEQQGENPAGSNPLQGHTLDLMDRLAGQRNGWKLLNVYGPDIVRKDEHPWLGYADCLGHVFKTDPNRSTDAELQLFSQLRVRPNTFFFPYNQRALENCDSIIRQSGNTPLNALSTLCNAPENYYRPYSKILDPAAWCCIKRLPRQDLDHLVKEINLILTEKPNAYYSAQRISQLLEPLPESLPEGIAISQQLNKLSGTNKNGDTAEAIKIIETIKPRIGEFGKGIKYRFWANFIDYCQNSLNFNKAIEASKDVLHEALKDINDIDTAAHCIGGHMQTHAHMGQTDTALELWNTLYEVQKSTADRIRYLTYKISLLYDGKNFDQAINCCREVLSVGGFTSFAEAAGNNQYLAAALLKLEYSSDFLPQEDRSFLLHRLSASKYHPGQLINFWRIMLLQKEGIPAGTLKNELMEQLNNDQPCEALWLIMACISDQLVNDNVLQSGDCRYHLDDLAGESEAIKKQIREFPVKKDETLGCLNPLRFNFI